MEGIKAKKTNGSRETAKPLEAPKFDVKSFLSSVGTGGSTENYQPKKVVFQQGDLADAIFYIQRCTIELSVVSAQGKEGIVAILGAGDFFAEGCFAGQPLHRASTGTSEVLSFCGII